MEAQIEQVEQVITAIISADNAQREQAEAQLEQACQTNTKQTLAALVQVMASKPALSELAAMLIQKKILVNKVNSQKLEGEDFNALIKTCVDLVENPESSLNSLKRVAEILVHMFRATSSDEGQGNLKATENFFNLLEKYQETTDKKIKLFLLYILETLAEFTYEESVLVSASGKFTGYFSKFMEDADPEIKIEAAGALIAFLTCLTEEKHLGPYSSALPTLITLLIDSVKSDETKGLKMVNSLDSLIKSHPKFIKNSLPQLLDVFTEMAKEPALTAALRNAAMLTIGSMAATNAGLIRKTPKFAQMTLPCLINIVAEQPDDLTEWLKSEDTHELSNQLVSANAVETISRLNESLGPKFMLQNTIQIAFQYIKNGNWKEKYAGLMTLAMEFEGCKDHFEGELDNFIQLLVPTLTIDNYKVLYASMTCIALLTTEFSPDLQEKYHALILPPVINILEKAPEDKLKLRATSMMINFFRELLECDEEENNFIHNYVSDVLKLLISNFESALAAKKMIFIEEIVSLISILAGISAEKFQPFYSQLMPGFKKLVFETPDDSPENNKIRALTISSLGYVISSHKEDPAKIEGDIMEIMNYLVELGKKLPADDAQHKSILEVYEVLVGALKDKFLPFLPAVLEHTMQCADRDIGFVVEDYLGGDDKTKDATTGGKKDAKADKQAVIDLKILGGKKMITMNHENLEQKVVAFDMMRQVTKVLKKNMRPYLEPIVEKLYSHIDYKFSTIIRDFCIKTVKHLMGVCSTEEEAKSVFEKFAPKMLDCADKFLKINNDEKSYWLLKNIKACAEQLMTTPLNPQIADAWFNCLKAALLVCKKRKEEVIKDYGDVAKLTGDDRDDFEADFAEPNMLMHVVMDTSSLWLKRYNTTYEEQIVNELGMYFFQTSQKFHVEDEIHYSVCFYAELFNHCSPKYVEQGYNVVLDTCLGHIEATEDVNFQQTGAYLLGVLAKKCTKEQYVNYAPRALALLTKYLQETDAKSEDKKIRTDTVLGAFGKLCMYQLNPADAKTHELTLQFLSTLPLQADPEEAQYIHKLVMKELNRKNAALLGNEALQKASQEALTRISQVATTNPELEILNDEGKELLKTTLGN